MLLNSRFNNFHFFFPKTFFDPLIEKRYEPFFKRIPIPFTDLTDFMSYTIQTVSWPSISTELVEQFTKTGVSPFKAGHDIYRYLSKDISITFKTVEGYLNYFVMLDSLELYWSNYIEKNTYLPNLTLYLLDHYGYLLMSVHYIDIIYSGLSELELSFASNVPEYRTFTANFRCKSIEIKREFQ